MIVEEKLITICDDRFEIISKAKKHIIEATNIEMSPKEMEVLDNFLFRCWQMGWLKNDYKALEIENAKLNRDKTELINSVTELKTKVTELEEKPKNNSYVQILQNEKAEMAEDFAEQIEKMKVEIEKKSKLLEKAISFIEEEDMQCKLCSYRLSCDSDYCFYSDDMTLEEIIYKELEKRVNGS